jgi:type IV pilus assembly protein PilE
VNKNRGQGTVPFFGLRKEKMKYQFHKRKSGFTLIELMVVVVIIAIVAALAIPRFMKVTTRTKQSEAEGILKQIYKMQRVYHQEYGTYAADGQSASANGSFVSLDIEIMSSARYTYFIIADSTKFTAMAFVNLDDDAIIDTWTIDQTGNLQCIINDAEI